MRKLRVTRSFIPNMFTLMNLFGGFMAIIRIAEGQFVQAAGFIVLSAVFDMLDGAVARLTQSTGEFGAELDSLCDAVSFGVAPAFMLYKAYFVQAGEYGVAIASLPALAGALRLARFNVQTDAHAMDKRYFRGMPIPAGALTILSYVLFYHRSDTPNAVVLLPEPWKPLAITAVTILTAAAMVSTIRYDALPLPTLRVIRERPLLMAFFTVGFLLGLLSQGALVFPFMLLYICAGAARGLWNVLTSLKNIGIHAGEGEDADDEELGAESLDV
jgi:CDP-diacylglycerol--serine O-phosphatidyltransferase